MREWLEVVRLDDRHSRAQTMTARAANSYTFRVGSRVCEMSLPPFGGGGPLIVAVSWLPDRPQCFTASERIQYLDGRDAALGHLLDLDGGIDALDLGLGTFPAAVRFSLAGRADD